MDVVINGRTMQLVAIADPATGNAAGATGGSDDAAWNGTDGSASSIAILKAIYAQNATMIGHLATIATNTTPP